MMDMNAYVNFSSPLIQAVKKRRALWDQTDANHYNRVVVNHLWMDVENEIGLDMKIAKAKWRGLRDYYRQQIRRNGDQPDFHITSSWAHFEEMSFIGNTVNPRSSIKIKEEPVTSPDNESKEWLQGPTNNTPWIQNNSKRKHLESESSDYDDDDLYFFKSLLPDLRCIPRAKKLLIRLKIQQLIYDEIYADESRLSEELDDIEQDETKEMDEGVATD